MIRSGMKMAAIVGMLLTGCVSGGPYCDEALVPRCPQTEGDRVAVCTRNGEEPQWDGSSVLNGTWAACDLGGGVICGTREAWARGENRDLVPGCFCGPGSVRGVCAPAE